MIDDDDDDDATLSKVLDSCSVTEDEYIQTLKTMRRKVFIIYKRKPNETMINPYNTVLLNLMKSNRNLQLFIGIYGLLAYLCSYMCTNEAIKQTLSLPRGWSNIGCDFIFTGPSERKI